MTDASHEHKDCITTVMLMNLKPEALNKLLQEFRGLKQDAISVRLAFRMEVARQKRAGILPHRSERVRLRV